MKKNRLEKAFIGIFLAIILVAGVSILVRFLTQKVLVDKLDMHNGFTEAVLFDQQEEAVVNTAALEDNQSDTLAPYYPASAEEADEANAVTEETVGAEDMAKAGGNAVSRLAAKFKSTIAYFEKGITNWATENIAAYKTWVGAATGYNKILRWSVTPRDGYNSVVFLADGSLTTFVGKQDMTEKANSILQLKAYADELGIQFLYVQYPFKISEADPESGTLDFSNQNANEKLDLLRAGGAQVLDLRQAWAEDGNDDSAAYHRSAFYVTDHHWRAETGLWAAGTIAKYVNDNFAGQIDLSVFEPDRYQYDVYEDLFLGSYGRQATLTLATPEDFTLVYPKFETSFSFPLLNAVQQAGLTEEQQQEMQTLEEKVRELDGSFEMFFDYSMLKRGDYYNTDTYTTYSDNVSDLVYIHNNLVDNGEKVLFLRDSYGRSLVPFFALGVSDTMRLRPDTFGGSLRTYMATERPNIVILLEG